MALAPHNDFDFVFLWGARAQFLTGDLHTRSEGSPLTLAVAQSVNGGAITTIAPAASSKQTPASPGISVGGCWLSLFCLAVSE